MTEEPSVRAGRRRGLRRFERTAIGVVFVAALVAALVVAVSLAGGSKAPDEATVRAEGEALVGGGETDEADTPADDDTPRPRPTATAEPTPTPDPRAKAMVFTARRQLQLLNVVDELSSPFSFDPDDYAIGEWPDSDGDCQDTRQEVLAAESVTRPRLTDDRCSVKVGEWIDPWTGDVVRIADARLDRMVSARHAHRAGAWLWTPRQREEFVQDEDPTLLNIVAAATAQAKGARSPENWTPSDEAYWCGYAVDWIRIKTKYQLNITRREQRILTDMLNTCNDRDSAGVRQESIDAPLLIGDVGG